MKISKLFHWLYAILMMLPVFFIGGRMIYVTFNKNAQQSWSGDYYDSYNYLYTYNEILDTDKTLYFNVSQAPYSQGNTTEFTILVNNFNVINTSLVNVDLSSTNRIYVQSYNTNSIITFYNGNTTIQQINTNAVSLLATLRVTGTSSVVSFNNFVEGRKIFYVMDDEITLDNAFEYSLNEVNTNPLFSWAKTSFLVEPFRYLTNLFGMPSDSPINTLLSYWLDISIIWLCFDVVMYVPLLAHRWIDKGMLE